MSKSMIYRVVGSVLVVVTGLTLILGFSSTKVSLASQPAPTPVTNTGSAISSLEAPDWVWATQDWTADEMAAAKPYPMPMPTDRSKLVSADVAFGQSYAGIVPGSVPFALPEDASPTGNTVVEALMPGATTSPLGYTYPAPFTRYTYYGKYTKEWPYEAVGKLFFYQDGFAYVCSASSIGNYAIWTAGHCVHDGLGSPSGWSYNVIFVPGYTYGKKQLGGIWKANHLWVTSDWYNYQNLGLDMGGAILNTLKNKRISQKVGALGFAWNFSPEEHWFELGYPAEYPFGGQAQVVCASSYAYSDSTFTPAPTGVGCDQTGGTSGGPWIWQWGSGWYLNGNMSYRYAGYSSEMYSPYFGDAAYNFYLTLVYDYPSK